MIVEPFTRKFFTQIKKTHFIGIDQSQLLGNEFEMIETVKKMVPFNINTLLVQNSPDRYQLLNDNKMQLILARSIELYMLLYKMSPQVEYTKLNNIRFVCALNSIPINILTTDMNTFEFGELKGSGLTVNVGPRGSSDFLIAADLLMQYKLIDGKDIHLSYYDAVDVVKHYGKDVQVVILARSHPDQTVLALVNTKFTKFIEILRYNNGNIYHMSFAEEKFYKEHPYYTKTIIEKETLHNYYTNLVLQEQIFISHKHLPVTEYKSRFINTINLKYYMLSNVMTPRSSIYQLLMRMKLNLNLINELPFIGEALNSASLSDFTLPMDVHSGASDFYQSSGLYTNIPDPQCLMIDGRCNPKLLREHHLVHDFGPTFNQMYNGGTDGSPRALLP